jgi:WD40 repeat protein
VADPVVTPADTYALVVGLDEYAEHAWRVPGGGPAADATEFARWLRVRGVPSKNIWLCRTPSEPTLPDIRTAPADSSGLFRLLTDTIAALPGGLFILYWAGHGLIDGDRERRLLWPDATRRSWANLDLPSLLTFLQSDWFRISRQICLIDACANYLTEADGRPTVLGGTVFSAGRPVPGTRLFALLATATGQVAKVRETGRFSEALRDELRKLAPDAWPPDIEAVASAVRLRLAELGSQTPVALDCQDWQGGVTIRRAVGETRRYDWGNAPQAPCFFGRQGEIETLREWVLDEGQCRVIAVVGQGGSGKTHLTAALREGGIGKTDLSLEVARQVRTEFECVVWRSLRGKRDAFDVLGDLLTSVAMPRVPELPGTVEGRIDRLLNWFRQKRCLVILDNFESVLAASGRGTYEPGAAGFGEMLKAVAEVPGRSCVLLTSREKPPEVEEYEGPGRPVRTLALEGLDVSAARQLCSEEGEGGLAGSELEWETAVSHYSGNPLALKLMAKYVRLMHAGNLCTFVHEGMPCFDRIQELLRWHFERLDEAEREVVYWLGIGQEPISHDELRADLRTEASRGKLAATLAALARKFPLERSDGGARLTLQAVVLEYVIDRLVTAVVDEIVTNSPRLLFEFAILKAGSAEFVRASQARLILDPIIDQFPTPSGADRPPGLKSCLERMLATLHRLCETGAVPTAGYAAGNILNLLVRLQTDLTGLDFSKLTVRQGRLDEASMHRVNFTEADLTGSVFQQDFGAVLSVAFHPRDPSVLAVGDAGGRVSLRRVPQGGLIRSLPGHNNYVMSVAFSPEGDALASCSYDRTVRVWDLRPSGGVRVLDGLDAWVLAVRFSPNGRLLARADEKGVITIWDTTAWEVVTQLKADDRLIWSLAFTPDSRRIISGNDEGVVRVWDLASGLPAETFKHHSESVRAVAVDPTGGLFATGSYDGTVSLIDAVSGTLKKTLRGAMGEVWTVLFGPEEGQLTCGSADGALRVWGVESGECVRTMLGHTNWIVKTALSSDRRTLATAGNDRTLRFWDAATGDCLNVVQGFTNTVFSVATAAAAAGVAAGYEDGRVRVWPADGSGVRVFDGHRNWVLAVALNPAGTVVASGGYEPHIWVYDVGRDRPARRFEGHKQWVVALGFSPDGAVLASGGYDKDVRLWDIANGTCRRVFHGHQGWVWGVAFDYTGQRVVSGGDDRTVRLWDVNTGADLGTFSGHGSRVRAVVFQPKGDVVASAGYDRTVRLWDLGTGRSQTLEGHADWVMAVAFSHNGELLASASYDGTVRLWEVNSRKNVHVFTHAARMESIAFSADDSTIFSGGSDGAVCVWDVQTRSCRELLQVPKPYEGMDITGARGFTDSQRSSLRALGAIDRNP